MRPNLRAAGAVKAATPARIGTEARVTHMDPIDDVPAEFSRIVAIDRLDGDEGRREIAADAGERAALAERFGLLGLDSLTASVRLKRVRGGAVRVTASFTADVVQACVVTLAPVPAHIEESFTILYAREAAAPGGAEVVVPLEDETLPEPLAGNTIDIGEAVAQNLAVALDPYPRAPGARLQDVFEGAGEGETPPADRGPFAALASFGKKAKD